MRVWLRVGCLARGILIKLQIDLLGLSWMDGSHPDGLSRPGCGAWQAMKWAARRLEQIRSDMANARGRRARYAKELVGQHCAC
jgi:hypothetical protein